MEHFYNARVLTLRPNKGGQTRATASVFAPKMHHMVANIYNAVEFASLQNLFVTCNENRFSALKFDRAGN